MNNQQTKSVYKLSFFFDYNCGGCLWCDNDAARQKFGVGTLDAEMFDLKGNIVQEARIKLPAELKHLVTELDSVFLESLDWNNPGGQSIWTEEQFKNFHKRAKDLCEKISQELGDDFEVVYAQK
jgi:hypothetical protein